MNSWYGKARQRAADTGLAWSTASVRAMLLTDDYTPDLDADQFVSDIPGIAIISRCAALTGKTNTLGTLDSDSFVFVSVPAALVTRMAAYVDTGSDATSYLLFLDDTAQGLPKVTSGGNVNGQWSSSPNRAATI